MYLVNASVQDFVRQPSEEDWTRLSVYARRMRHFMEHGHDFPSEAALKFLNAHLSGRCMLPNLQDVRWLGASPEHLEPMYPLIVSSALTNFRLALKEHGSLDALKIVPTLEALAPAYNSLVEIRICHPTMHDPQIINAASTLLLKCNPDKLRYFHVDSALSTEALVHAAQLPNLEMFHHSDRRDGIRHTAPPVKFSLPQITGNQSNKLSFPFAPNHHPYPIYHLHGP